MEAVLNQYIALHVGCIVVNIYREIYETKLGTIGQFMRALEVIALSFNIMTIISSLDVFVTTTVLRTGVTNQRALGLPARDCLVEMGDWGGNTREFIYIETTI